jgi:uncharacterized membrane protein YhdT
MNQPPVSPPPGDSWLAIATSVLAAFMGVQSDSNRQRDFSHGSPVKFVIGGLIFTLLFILSVYAVVSLVLKDVK